MKKKLIILFVFVISFSIGINAKIQMNFTRFHQLMKANDPTYKNFEIDYKKYGHQINANLPTPATQISISQENGFNSDTDQNTDVLTGEISKSFVSTGTNLSLSHSKTTRPDRQENVSKLRVEQSLYKNYFGKNIKLQEEALSKEQEVGDLEFKENQEGFLAKNLKSYFYLGKLKNDSDLSKQIYEESKKLNSTVASKRRLKIATETDVNRSRLQDVVYFDDFQTKKNLYDRQLMLIAQNIKFDLFDISKDELKILESKLEAALKGHSFDLSKIRSIQVSRLNEQSNLKKFESSKRYNLPEVKLVVGYNQDDSTRFATRIERNETVVGVGIDIPLGDSRGKAQKELAHIDHLKSLNEFQLTSINMQNQILEKKSQLALRKQKYENDLKKIKLIKNILKDEERRFQIGKIDLETLINVKNNYATYRLNLVDSHYQYIENLIDYLNLVDRLEFIEI